MVKDLQFKVSPDEFDEPPPSKKSLGGEADVSQGDMRSGADFSSPSTYAVPAGYDNPIVYITAAGGITPVFTHAFMLVSGSNASVTITANPQIAAGQQGQVLSLLCADSSITFSNGTGLALMGSARFIMNSGASITLIYNTGSTVWWETARYQGGN